MSLTPWFGARQPSPCWLALVLFVGNASLLRAQEPLPRQRPTPGQVRDLLGTRPALVEQLRRRLRESGLTPDQVRARLRAAGYPESLLDSYLAGADTTDVRSPGPRTIDAVRTLGILAPMEIDSLVTLDSLGFVSDSARRAADSLGAIRADSLRADSLADSIRVTGTGLKRFGIEVFRRATTRFQPTQAGPVDQNYRLGPGDILALVISGEVEQFHTLDVTREGFVVIPQVGQVYVANLTMAQLEDQLYVRLGRVYSGVRRTPNATTKFYVSVARLRTIQVFVVGDVVRPGSFQMSSAGTVLTALYAAGGPTESGSFRRVEIRRGGKLLDSLDIYDYLLRGINRSDIRLESGDVVFVPVQQGLVKVAGKVMRPAVYEIKPGETLRDVIQAAGGFAPEALRQRVQLHRILPPDSAREGGRARIVIDLGADQFAGGVAPTFPMAQGDSVTIFEVAERVRGFVTVKGNVWVEGQVGFAPGLKLSEAIRLAGGPKPDVYLPQILVSRLRSDSTRVQLRSSFADSTGALTRDLALEEEDEIEVFSRTAFRAVRYISVVGAVRNPGRVSYREGMTVRDAVLLAGGVTEDAYLKEAEIARLSPDPQPGSLAQTIRVPLDSTYIFGRQPGDGAYTGPPGIPAPASGAQEVTVQPYDNVLIMRQPGWDVQRLVDLTGQVKYPGRYALLSKTERLSELLQRAGGLTEEAYPGGVEFYRAVARVRRAREDGANSTTGRLGEQYLIKERVGVDLPRVLEDPKFRDNLILTGGDSISIPEFDPTIMVQGGVNSPGPVAYTPGKSIDWYISAAGGYARLGDRNRAYVTQPNGKKQAVKRRFLLPDGSPKPRAGAMVFVPEKDPTAPPGNTASILGTVAQVLGAVTTIVILLTTR